MLILGEEAEVEVEIENDAAKEVEAVNVVVVVTKAVTEVVNEGETGVVVVIVGVKEIVAGKELKIVVGKGVEIVVRKENEVEEIVPKMRIIIPQRAVSWFI